MIDRAILNRVSREVQEEFGSKTEQCRPIAERAKVLLAEHGINARVAAGYAVFRVSKNEVLIYHPKPWGIEPDPFHPCDEVCHCWLEVDDLILDFTPYSFRKLLAEDAIEEDEIEWCPDFVCADPDDLSSYDAVVRGFKAGSIHYETRILEESAG